MGDPKRQKKKFSTPSHPWQETRIAEEKEIIKEYGLKNKKEIWKATSKLRNFKQQAKKLISAIGKQAETEKLQLINKLQRLGLLKKTGQLDDILALEPKDILERRLQTLVLRKGLAKSIKQARQFIVHGHISVAKKRVTSPSYLVTVEEESSISFVESSKLAKPDHPERVIDKKKKLTKEKK